MELTSRHPELQFAMSAVALSVQLVKQIQAGIKTEDLAMTKHDDSPVTIADFAVQALVGYLLSEFLTGARLVGEESSQMLRTEKGAATLERVVKSIQAFIPEAGPESVCQWIDAGTAEPEGAYWVLDPIDGTKGFLRGEQYAVALAKMNGGTIELAVLGCPHLEQGCIPKINGGGSLVVAMKDRGAWATSLDLSDPLVRLKVSDCSDVRQARILRSVETSSTNAEKTEKILKSLDVQTGFWALDSMAKYAVVAGGQAECFSYLPSAKTGKFSMKIWDIAPGALVVEEAGGKVSDLQGNPIDYTAGKVITGSGLLITNGLLHATFVEALQKNS